MANLNDISMPITTRVERSVTNLTELQARIEEATTIEDEALLVIEKSSVNQNTTKDEHNVMHITDDQTSYSSVSPTRFGRKLQNSSSTDAGGVKEKNIFISYSPDAGFTEKQFTCTLVLQLKENYMAGDIWFDKDELIIGNSKRFSERLQAAEQCRAAILILSNSYFNCPVTQHECAVLLERQSVGNHLVDIYCVNFELITNSAVTAEIQQLISDGIDLCSSAHQNRSIAEKSSFVVGEMVADLERFCLKRTLPTPPITPTAAFRNEFLRKRVIQWNVSDVQDWLVSLNIREYYRENIAESRVDGFLLLTLTDTDMAALLDIESKSARKKIMQHIILLLEKECRLDVSWHIRAKLCHPKANCVYIVCDAADTRLMHHLKLDLSSRGLKVYHNEPVLQGPELIGQANGLHIAMATHVLVILTENVNQSTIVFHETVFADWLGRRIVVGVFKNCWIGLRPGLKALLGECVAVDFERKLYGQCVDVLLHHIKPQRTVPGVVLEHAYVSSMEESLRPLAVLCSTTPGDAAQLPGLRAVRVPEVFVTYSWDMQARAELVVSYLESHGIRCSTDAAPTIGGQSRAQSRLLGQRGGAASSIQLSPYPTSAMQLTPFSPSAAGDNTPAGFHWPAASPFAHSANRHAPQPQIAVGMRAAAALVLCVSGKFVQSDRCVHSLLAAQALDKPIVPVLLRLSAWPPDGTPAHLRRLLSQLVPTDLSTDRLMKCNLPQLVDRLGETLSL